MNELQFSPSQVVNFLSEDSNNDLLVSVENRMTKEALDRLKVTIKGIITKYKDMGDLLIELNRTMIAEVDYTVLCNMDIFDFVKMLLEAKEQQQIETKAATKPNNKWVEGLSKLDTKVLNYLRNNKGEFSVKALQLALFKPSKKDSQNITDNMNVRNSLNRLVAENLVYRRTIDHDTRSPKRNCYEYSAL